MEKVTLKFAEYSNHPQGYELMYPPTEEDEWNFIFKNIPEEKKYLKHFVKREWMPTEGYHYGYGDNKFAKGIPLGILTYYIDLYYEDK